MSKDIDLKNQIVDTKRRIHICIFTRYATQEEAMKDNRECAELIDELVEQSKATGIQEGEKKERERIKPYIERVRLDVDVIVCDCGEKYKDSDLDLSVGELEEFNSKK